MNVLVTNIGKNPIGGQITTWTKLCWICALIIQTSNIAHITGVINGQVIDGHKITDMASMAEFCRQYEQPF